MKTVNSLSGGKTSSYMAVHYPADVEVFSLITIEAEYCRPKDDGLAKAVSDKIGREFIATAESDKTLKVMLDLEQMIGREIIWVVGDTFEELCRKRSYLPNQAARFCTTQMKLYPIVYHCINNVADIVDMRVGFRHDEIDRAERNKDNTRIKVIIGKTKTGNRNKWKEIEWRKLSFPLVDNYITHHDVVNWVSSTSLDFPADSNCVGCFWKPIQQLRKNWDDEPLKMRWFSEMEREFNTTWRKEFKYEDIKNLGLQQDFFFGTGAGCQAGFCTD